MKANYVNRSNKKSFISSGCYRDKSAPNIMHCATSRAIPAAKETAEHQWRWHSQTGQGMTEYIVIVALVAVAAIGTYSLLGQTVRNQTAGLALEISGQSGQAAIANARTNATNANTQGNNRKGLDNYELNNH
ncbi:MAG: hypothetical protein WBD13_24090 [Burkholderiaceae bacterium]